MFKIIRNSFRDFKESYIKYLFFALLFLFLTSFLFVPLTSYIFNRMLMMISSGSLLNAEVYRIGVTTPGIIGMLLISLVAVVALFIEFGVMIVIAQKRYFQKNILVAEAFITTVRKLPTLLGFGFFQLLLLLLITIPFFDLSTLPALIDFNLPIFLTTAYYEATWMSLLFYFFIVLIVLYIVIKSIFTLHYIIVEGKSIWKAMFASFRTTKQNKLTIIFNLCMLNILFFLAFFLFTSLLSFIPSLIDTRFIGNFVQSYLLTFTSYMTIIFSLLLIPINVIIVTRLFYRFKWSQGEIVEDQLHVYGNKYLVSFENKITKFFTRKKVTVASVIMIYITSMFFLNYTVNDNIVYLKWNVQVAAHRGDLHAAPENSMSAISAAIEGGADAVEFDIMLTKDGEIILNHDYDLQRVAGIPTRVSEMTYEEIREIDIGRLFSDRFIGERIPTLDDVFEEIQEENVTIIVDVKVNDHTRREEFAKKIVASIEEFELIDTAYVQAFDNAILREIRSLNSDIKIGQILFMAAGNLEGLDVDFYTIRQTMLSERFIRNARRQNRGVWVWTVNIERNMREVLKYDIDGIITDYPEKALNLIGINFTVADETESGPDNP
ncbi:glycerophosphodiester phosphodiesterase family protein [Evansella sp. AB-rgal1]|uniref:glycerophosphodiester phosphodiesterase family protein n=1 Tax=Evansella sp. AB-rgal1 TaxID=3242696 RepID=UPI00359E5BAB